MKKQNTLFAYLLIGIGLYFLLKQLQFPILTNFYSWQSLLIIIGLAFLIHSFSSKHYQNLFTGTLLLGLGIHFHGLAHYGFWIDHWASYTLIIGIAFLVRAWKTKQGFLMGFLFTILSIIFIFSSRLSIYFYWLDDVVGILEMAWPILLIVVGIFFLFKRK
ncbi:hypothetical protein D8M04_01335 [Oceanobacillus piezotolerans]|uniref:LiaI-LiaF-like transmembrane region domain-containing protein n=1 Tax=Oceanobacillus piezotolerans TaxID=2448030 RepID=A0A498DFH4_9BACI|nr:DUF5668 domain-containing protein [Oceanobacillus piezotolerans]RLL47948.1 hypothetical protein D8M04_01335 [Oceanobacillus piezotolerans]